MRITKKIRLRLTKMQKLYCYSQLILLSRLWNEYLTVVISMALQNKGFIKPFAYIKSTMYSDFVRDFPEFEEISTKSRGRLLEDAWRCFEYHWLLPGADREVPMKDEYKNIVTSFFFVKDGIRFTNSDHSRIWIPVMHEVKLCEKGYLTEKDLSYIKSGRILFDRTRSHWYILFNLDVPKNYFYKDADIPIETAPIGIDVGVSRYITIATHDPLYKYPYTLQMDENPCLNNITDRIEAKISKNNSIIDRLMVRNRNRYGYDIKDRIKDIDPMLVDEIFYSRQIRRLEHRNNKLYAKLHNYRRDFIKKTCSVLANEHHRFICIENLDVHELTSRMRGNGNLRRKIMACNFYYFRRYLTWKCESLNGRVLEADVTFISTNRCSCCGKANKDKLPLTERTYICQNPNCNMIMDRDLNAAYNLLYFGLTRLPEYTICDRLV